MEFNFSLSEIEAVADRILEQTPQKIIVFKGQMGAGKTTFIKALCKKLGVKNATSSPTFSLVNEYYTIDNQIVYHFDFYRIKNEVEALNIGTEDYFYSGNYCLIEWPEKIPNLLPENHAVIEISVLENQNRKLKFT